jgi:hypothetical protein
MASDFPTREDVALWDKYDATYGMDEAGQLQRGAKNPTMPLNEIQLYESVYDQAKTDEGREYARQALEDSIQRLPMDESRREALMRNFIASRRSGVASLGFDPGRTVLSQKEENLPPGAQTLGFSLKDYTYSKRDPRSSGATPVHESMHQGIEQLLKDSDTKPGSMKRVDAKASDKTFHENEIATRALMQKYYGGIEREGDVKSDKKQFDEGTVYLMDNMDFLNQLEEMAAAELKRRGRPMGPR